MSLSERASLRRAIREAHRADEQQIVEALIEKTRFTPSEQQHIFERARPLVQAVRDRQQKSSGIEAFLNTYRLSSHEGVVLMCLAETLLRIPDTETIDLLIRDKIGHTDWAQQLGASHSTFVNAGTWTLMLTGHIVAQDDVEKNFGGTLKRLIHRVGEPVIRQATVAAMRILGRQFIMGETIEAALERASGARKLGYRHSFDMLGESVRTDADALRYYETYSRAIEAIGTVVGGEPALVAPSISVKLSALHPRFEAACERDVRRELWPAVRNLAQLARRHGIGFTIDAEEADRLELSLDLFEALALDVGLAGWDGLGLAVQAYQKRSLALIDWLAELAHCARRRLGVRLVKGAYWDAEIKATQERGLSGYPVFTRKAFTDVSYLACARRLLDDPAAFYPAFATHNAHTLAAVAQMAGGNDEWEYQRLHGMGQALYEEVVGPGKWGRACRVYAPVGGQENLLAYLMRRLLENGANSSFVNRIADAHLPIGQLLADPAEKAAALGARAHPGIALPGALFEGRINSEGLDMNDKTTFDDLRQAIDESMAVHHEAAPVIGGTAARGKDPRREIRSPADWRDLIGDVVETNDEDAAEAIARAVAAFPGWEQTPAVERAAVLDRSADMMQRRLREMAALLVREAGQTQGEAVFEVREAIDLCRYYAAQAREKFAMPSLLQGPTGEENTLSLHGRGVFACISAWNSPLAVFIGQVAAALVTGNTVVAKPARQTPLVAAQAVCILHEAGVPGEALAFLPGDGAVGAALVADPRCAGVAFTGSREVAREIACSLAARPGPMVPLIAQTGGQNAMIVDSSALPEQVVRDVLASAFSWAGQRCSSLHVLFLQEDIADKVSGMLRGAMQTLRIGNPTDIRTDIGPVIDDEAHARLEKVSRRLDGLATSVCTCRADAEPVARGSFFAPRVYEIADASCLEQEVSGPILHIIRWCFDDLDSVCESIAGAGDCLVLGIHSRIDETVERIVKRLPAGDIYVNRRMGGAMPGSQPFGGGKLSGTGPKAGGPHYLHRFVCERTLSVDTTASGGNASLMSLEQGTE